MANPELQHFWQQTLADWQASGLSGAAFCKQQSLSYHQFGYWRRKLKARTDNKGDAERMPGFARVAPVQQAGAADELSVLSVTGLHAGNIELLGAILRQL